MKAVLVIDVEEYGDYYADVYRKDADDRFDGRYYLKPLPQKRINKDCLVVHEIWNEGWNACVDEIMGETNG